MTGELTIYDNLQGKVEIKDMLVMNGEIKEVTYKYIDVTPCYSCQHIAPSEYKKIHSLTKAEPFDWELTDIAV